MYRRKEETIYILMIVKEIMTRVYMKRKKVRELTFLICTFAYQVNFWNQVITCLKMYLNIKKLS